jgi:hypothetical protein
MTRSLLNIAAGKPEMIGTFEQVINNCHCRQLLEHFPGGIQADQKENYRGHVFHGGAWHHHMQLLSKVPQNYNARVYTGTDYMHEA